MTRFNYLEVEILDDPTTAPTLRSFIPVAPNSHFPIQNLPYGVFKPSSGGSARVGTAIGDQVLDLSVLEKKGFFSDTVLDELEHSVFDEPFLNAFMRLGRRAWKEAREQVSSLLRADNPLLRDDKETRRKAFYFQADVEMCLPVFTIDYTDFYSSKYHAFNVGMMFRGPENALQPNWLHLPVGYHGRASSLVVSGKDVRRPRGQILPSGSNDPILAPTMALDFELEMGAYVGIGNELGHPIPIEKARDHLFGMVLVNDWSARDLQRWEYVPLGPFLGKSFATSISPWVVTLDALEPFRVEGPLQDPEPLPYLRFEGKGAYDIHLEVAIQVRSMDQPHVLSRTNFKYLYWNVFQQVAHHSINGCNLQTGDLLASGTISGPTPDSLGCLLEITQNGKKPLILPNGETRRYLQDGDRVIMRGWCQGKGYRVGFGEVSCKILPAL